MCREQMNIYFLVIILFGCDLWFGNVFGLKGDNVCQEQERYVTAVRKPYKKAVRIRGYKWCLQVPPRCEDDKTVYVDDFRIEEEVKIRFIEKCCPGFKHSPINDSCVPMLCDYCDHGQCNPTIGDCICDDGYSGENCDQRCPYGRWGFGCMGSCDCHNNVGCQPTDGVCICEPGWIGKRCDVKCPNGKYGHNCRNTCSECLYQNKTCDPINGLCITTPTNNFVENHTESSPLDTIVTKIDYTISHVPVRKSSNIVLQYNGNFPGSTDDRDEFSPKYIKIIPTNKAKIKQSIREDVTKTDSPFVFIIPPTTSSEIFTTTTVPPTENIHDISTTNEKYFKDIFEDNENGILITTEQISTSEESPITGAFLATILNEESDDENVSKIFSKVSTSTKVYRFESEDVSQYITANTLFSKNFDKRAPHKLTTNLETSTEASIQKDDLTIDKKTEYLPRHHILSRIIENDTTNEQDEIDERSIQNLKSSKEIPIHKTRGNVDTIIVPVENDIGNLKVSNPSFFKHRYSLSNKPNLYTEPTDVSPTGNIPEITTDEEVFPNDLTKLTGNLHMTHITFHTEPINGESITNEPITDSEMLTVTSRKTSSTPCSKTTISGLPKETPSQDDISREINTGVFIDSIEDLENIDNKTIIFIDDNTKIKPTEQVEVFTNIAEDFRSFSSTVDNNVETTIPQQYEVQTKRSIFMITEDVNERINASEFLNQNDENLSDLTDIYPEVSEYPDSYEEFENDTKTVSITEITEQNIHEKITTVPYDNYSYRLYENETHLDEENFKIDPDIFEVTSSHPTEITTSVVGNVSTSTKEASTENLNDIESTPTTEWKSVTIVRPEVQIPININKTDENITQSSIREGTLHEIKENTKNFTTNLKEKHINNFKYPIIQTTSMDDRKTSNILQNVRKYYNLKPREDTIDHMEVTLTNSSIKLFLTEPNLDKTARTINSTEESSPTTIIVESFTDQINEYIPLSTYSYDTFETKYPAIPIKTTTQQPIIQTEMITQYSINPTEIPIEPITEEEIRSTILTEMHTQPSTEIETKLFTTSTEILIQPDTEIDTKSLTFPTEIPTKPNTAIETKPFTVSIEIPTEKDTKLFTTSTEILTQPDTEIDTKSSTVPIEIQTQSNIEIETNSSSIPTHPNTEIEINSSTVPTEIKLTYSNITKTLFNPEFVLQNHKNSTVSDIIKMLTSKIHLITDQVTQNPLNNSKQIEKITDTNKLLSAINSSQISRIKFGSIYPNDTTNATTISNITKNDLKSIFPPHVNDFFNFSTFPEKFNISIFTYPTINNTYNYYIYHGFNLNELPNFNETLDELLQPFRDLLLKSQLNITGLPIRTSQTSRNPFKHKTNSTPNNFNFSVISNTTTNIKSTTDIYDTSTTIENIHKSNSEIFISKNISIKIFNTTPVSQNIDDFIEVKKKNITNDWPRKFKINQSDLDDSDIIPILREILPKSTTQRHDLVTTSSSLLTIDDDTSTINYSNQTDFFDYTIFNITETSDLNQTTEKSIVKNNSENIEKIHKNNSTDVVMKIYNEEDVLKDLERNTDLLRRVHDAILKDSINNNQTLINQSNTQTVYHTAMITLLGIAIGIFLAIIIASIILYMTDTSRKVAKHTRSRLQNTVLGKKDFTHSQPPSVHYIQRDEFMTPLQDRITIFNPKFTAEPESTFGNLMTNDNCRDKVNRFITDTLRVVYDNTYDHPQSPIANGSFVGSTFFAPKSDPSTEHLYDEIPAWKQPKPIAQPPQLLQYSENCEYVTKSVGPDIFTTKL